MAKPQSPADHLEQILKGKLDLQASKRRDAERYAAEAAEMQAEIDEMQHAIDWLRSSPGPAAK